MRSPIPTPPVVLALALAAAGSTQAADYRLPPQAAIDIIDAPRPPAKFLSPGHQLLLLAEVDEMRSIEELARPFLRFAGMRVLPNSNSQVKTRFYREPLILRPADGAMQPLRLPAGAMLGVPIWSHDSRYVALPRYTDSGVELWVADTLSGRATAVCLASDSRLRGRGSRTAPGRPS